MFYKIKYLTILISISISIIFLNLNQLKAENRDATLNQLFNELKINNQLLAHDTEIKIWNLWSTHPTNRKLTMRLKEGSNLAKSNQLLKAIEIFTEVIKKDPKWAEAWNKRATVLYLLGDYQGSQDDINKVLELEERHFGALAGQGLVNIKLENYEKAIDSYKKAQEIYPAMQSPKIMIDKIEKLIKQQLI
tara:strand:- start:1196 stop:1768 length:573 start_codon:yes stop_codon:yes gene_type:complete